MNLFWVIILIGHLYLSGVWLDVAPRIDTQNKSYLKKIGLCAQCMITILGSMIKLISLINSKMLLIELIAI